MIRRTVKVPKKLIVIVIVIYAACAAVIAAAGGDYLFQQAQKHVEAGNPAEALAYLDQMLDQYPRHRRAADALFLSARLFPHHTHFSAVLFADASSVSRSTLPPAFGDAGMGQLERLQRLYDQYPDFPQRELVISWLALRLHEANAPEAEDMLWQALHLPHGPNMAEVAFALVQRYLAVDHPEAALEVLEYLETHHPGHLPADRELWRGDVHAQSGDTDLALEAYDKALQLQEESLRTMEDAEGRPILTAEQIELSLDYFRSSIQQRRQRALEQTDMGWVTGRVSLLGRPLAGVTVVAEPTASSSSWGGPSETYPYRAVTSADGTYELAIPASESVRVGLHLDLAAAQKVDGTHLHISSGQVVVEPEGWVGVNFEFRAAVEAEPLPAAWSQADGPLQLNWKPVPDAAGYRVTLRHTTHYESSSSTVTVGRWEVEEAHLVLEPASVNWPDFGAYSMHPRGVDPVHFLGIWKIEGSLSLNIEALDENNTILSSSGLQLWGPPEDSLLQVQPEPLTEGERLLQDREYAQAVSELEGQLEVEPANTELMYTLARLYFSGTHPQADDWQHFQHRDLQQSRFLLQQLQTIAPDPRYEEALRIVDASLQRP